MYINIHTQVLQLATQDAVNTLDHVSQQLYELAAAHAQVRDGLDQ